MNAIKIQKHDQRLEESGSIASESTCVDWVIYHVENPECDHVVESSKYAPGTHLDTC